MTRRLLTISDGDLRSLATALRAGRFSAPFTETALKRYISTTAAPDVAAELQNLASAGFDTSQIATVIDLLVEQRSQQTVAEDMIDLVTSGPEGSTAANRDTSVVVRELFANATESVVVVGYAVYQGQQVFQALAHRMEELPSLNVRMFLDIPRPDGDASDASVLVSRFVQRFKTQQWPKSDRLPKVFYDPRSHDPESTNRASLHAKCVVVDRRQILVSSANFTRAGQRRNIEVGLLVTSEALAAKLIRHVETMVSEGLLLPAIW